MLRHAAFRWNCLPWSLVEGACTTCTSDRLYNTPTWSSQIGVASASLLQNQLPDQQTRSFSSSHIPPTAPTARPGPPASSTDPLCAISETAARPQQHEQQQEKQRQRPNECSSSGSTRGPRESGSSPELGMTSHGATQLRGLKTSPPPTAAADRPNALSDEAVAVLQKDLPSTARALANNLTESERTALASALIKGMEVPSDRESQKEFFRALETVLPHESPDRLELQQFLDGKLKFPHSGDPPMTLSMAELRMVSFASSLPFIGFGFLDNCIMLSVGGEIDTALALKLGLTSLASAGLGNLVAAVVGVSAHAVIEQMVTKSTFIKKPSLCPQQRSMGSYRKARVIGAMTGVAVGCLLGMFPLVASGHLYTH